MIKRFVVCAGGILRVREGGVWGEYCVGEWMGKERGGLMLIWGRAVVLQGGSATREWILVNGWYQERWRGFDQMREGQEAVKRRDVREGEVVGEGEVELLGTNKREQLWLNWGKRVELRRKNSKEDGIIRWIGVSVWKCVWRCVLEELRGKSRGEKGKR